MLTMDHEIEQEDACKEFNTDSLNQKERIEARRQRIKERFEKSSEPSEDKSKKVSENLLVHFKEYNKSKKQIKDSYDRLLKLKTHGSELVTNVQIAVNARETLRRNDEEEFQQKRIEKLEAEARAAEEKFEEITRKWEIALSKETPQDLNEMLTSQRSLCTSMVDEKNKLIDELQEELKREDDQYVKDLRKQAEDVDLILERMEEETKTLTKAFEEEQQQIEKQFEVERRELMTAQQKKYEQLCNNRRDKEIEFLKAYEQSVDDFNHQLQTMRVQDAEEYNTVKIKLETDVQILQQNIQQMKATFQLNQEKLEYNFQVLKKRDEENTITKSQQKRKITRLQDSLNNLKQKCSKQEHQYRDEHQSLVDDLKRITEQHHELQKKARHFYSTDTKRLADICIMNDQQAKSLVRDLMEEDKIIHEQQLGLTWQPSESPFDLTFSKSAVSGKTTTSALDFARNTLNTATNESTPTRPQSDGSRSQTRRLSPLSRGQQSRKGIPSAQRLSNSSIKQMLERLCDESGFLVEAKLMKLLSPLDKDEQSLMKLDAIFNALGIQTEADIHLLSKYFYEDPDVGQRWADSSILVDVNDLSISGEERQLTNEAGHALVHPNEVIAILRRFVDETRSVAKVSQGDRLTTTTTSDDHRMKESYWSSISSVIDKKKERLWDALTDALGKYSHVLTERASLIEETDTLQQQNTEVRMILRQYINSKVNQELEIPPTRLLQFETRK